MVQLAKSTQTQSTQDFEDFGAQPWHRQGEPQNFKSQSDFGQMRRFQTRNCRI
jgi:hypothetical protein